jgi:single-stranded-DNA-specific exonuclease
VASRLVETYHLPTILVSVEGDEGKGSARSIPAFHLTEALRKCHVHLIKYGGHKYAAGLSIRREDIPAFREKVKEVARTVLVPDDLVRKLCVDAVIDLSTIDDEFLAHLERFAPFGPHNTRPVFVSRGLKCAGPAQCVGPANKHLRLRVRQGQTVLDAIGFGFGDVAAELNRPHVAFDLAYVPEYNYWQGQKRVQLRVRDLHTYESGIYFSG